MAEPYPFHTVEVPIHGRYLLRVAHDERAPLLVGFHGYGESAERHLDAVLEIPGVSDWHVVAIQALSRFYRNRSGEVVASWMTRQDRELAIADNVRYVGAVLAQVEDELAVEAPRVALGFSQGTAMAYRAAAGSGTRFDGLVALAGDAPAEIFEGKLEGFPRVLIGRGREDDWYDGSKMERDLDLLRARGVEVETCVFDGAHEWTVEFYSACAKFLRSLQKR